MNKTKKSAACVIAAFVTLLGGCAQMGHAHHNEPREMTTMLPVLAQRPDPTPTPRHTSRVIQITLDGVRWQEVYLGVDPKLARDAGLKSSDVVSADTLLPNIYQDVIARGVALGAPGHGVVEASGPMYVSLPGYMELLLGARSGCESNDCPSVDRPTILDEVASMPGAAFGDAAVIASWDVLEKAAALDGTRVMTSTGRHGGKTRNTLRLDDTMGALLDESAQSSTFPGDGDYRPDTITAKLALAFVERRRPTFLHVGLGDTDEYAHKGDYNGYLSALRLADRFVGDLVAMLRARGELDDTTIVITADHGRARDFRNHGKSPECSRVFVLAAGGGVPVAGYATSPDPLHLADVAPTLRTLLGLRASTAITAMLPLPRRAGYGTGG